MQINLSWVHNSEIGYGRLGNELAKALTSIGVEVHDGLPTPTDASGTITGTACWVSVPTHAKGWWKCQRPVMFTMWEATNLPPAFRETMDEFETILVPSQQNVDLFSQYHPNVKLVTLGVDPADWHLTPRQRPRRFFDFLIGGSGPRKGTDLAFKAFGDAFPNNSWGNGPVPRLIMKNPRGEKQFFGDRIERVTGRISAEEEIATYERAHCYLQPSRGEGFGLQPLQAMAQGIPTILTGAHGHASFAHLGHALDSTLVKADYFIYGDAGDWWEPDYDQLVERMRWVYENYDAALAHAHKGSEVVAKEFTWTRCAEHFVEALGDLPPAKIVPDGTDGWYVPTRKQFPIILSRPYTADIGGHVYQWEKGKTYYESSDVKRILFDLNVLDPACLVGEMDVGLAPDQVEQIPDYTGRHAFCHSCHQQLNSGIQQADVLLAEEAAA